MGDCVCGDQGGLRIAGVLLGWEWGWHCLCRCSADCAGTHLLAQWLWQLLQAGNKMKPDLEAPYAAMRETARWVQECATASLSFSLVPVHHVI